MEYAMTVRTGGVLRGGERADPAGAAGSGLRSADGTVEGALDPRAIAAVAGHPELTGIAEDAAARLRAALDALPSAR
jgi:hypothetical protein